ncbi:transposase [Mesorhizobium sp. M0139]
MCKSGGSKRSPASTPSSRAVSSPPLATSSVGEPQKLVSYFGLNPPVRQSGLGLAQYGRISKHGRSRPRHAGRGRLGRRRRPDPSGLSSCASATSHQVVAVALAR